MATVTYEPGFSGPPTINHGDVVEITGPGGFGTKPTAEPLIWDDASGPDDIRNLWEDGWPVDTVNPDFSIQRRAAGWRGVQAPHGHTNRYITGCHGEGFDPFSASKGPNVVMWKNFPTNPAVTPVNLYVSYWQQIDPGWSFGGDNNFKNTIYGTSSPPTGGPRIWGSYGTHFPVSTTDFTKWQIVAELDNDTMMQPGSEFSQRGFVEGLNPFGRWIKFEHIATMTGAGDGIYRIYENGRFVLGYTGRTDANPATQRRFGIGGYARRYNQPTNFRYFTDCYIDTSFARVMLLNAGDFTGASVATVREIQVPSAWADTAITFTCWQGAHTTLEGTALWVVDPTNTPVLVATLGTGGEPPPEVPTITSPTTATGTVSEPFEYQITGTDNPTSFDAHGLLE